MYVWDAVGVKQLMVVPAVCASWGDGLGRCTCSRDREEQLVIRDKRRHASVIPCGFAVSCLKTLGWQL